ncbi:MAG: hypothetical protein KDG89_06740 [Geminicoccaceae bacterium]|nr:hypothetical protein [Geminicoccaceae bacterium]
MSVALKPYETRTRPQGPGLAANARPVDAGLGHVARGLSQAAGAAEAVVRVEEKRREERETIWAERTLAEREAYWATETARREREAPLGADGHAAGLAKDYAADAEAILGQAPSDRARARLEAGLTRLGGRLTVGAETFARDSRTKAQALEMGELQGAIANAVFVDPAGLPAKQAEYEATLDGLDMDEATRAALKAKGRETFARGAVAGLIERDPAGTVALLEKGGVEGLSAADREVMVNRGQAEVRRREAEAAQERRHQETLARQRAAERKAELAQRAADDAARAATGAPVTLERREAFDVYGDRGDEKYEAYRFGVEVASTAASLATMDPAERRAEMERLQPDPAEEGYADRLRQFRTLQDALARTEDAIRKDPVATIMATNGPVRDGFGAAAEAATPEERTQRLGTAQRTLMDEQVRQGVPDYEVRAWPKEEIEAKAGAILNEADPLNRARMLSDFWNATPEGPARRNAFADLEKQGMPAGVRHLGAAIEAGDVRGVADALGALQADVKLDKVGKDALDEAVRKSPIGRAARLKALHTGDARILAERDGLEAAARAYAAFLVKTGGMDADADAAWAKATRVYGAGRGEVAVPGLAAVTVPAGMDPALVQEGLDFKRGRLRGQVDRAAIEAGVKRLVKARRPGQDDAETARQARAMTEGVLADLGNAVWIEDEHGLYRPKIDTAIGPMLLPGVALTPDDALEQVEIKTRIADARRLDAATKAGDRQGAIEADLLGGTAPDPDTDTEPAPAGAVEGDVLGAVGRAVGGFSIRDALMGVEGALGVRR